MRGRPVDLSIRSLHGACLCEAVEYVVQDAFEYALNCHCSQCRRATGSAFKPLAGIARGELSFVRGEAATMTYGDADAHDVHCRTCGSLLFSVVREGAYAHVPLGGLKDEPTLKPSMHIFVGSKAAWYEITDDLPQHDAFPPD
ncbi:aldehyde-activating protein [Sphingomonas deserti]|uniref:Aldehyde-activating protein n=1 Tax=Allosphingosinicella deserti TaxID=2116704 RepID=A0A2P7QZE2_9SPHN|nr:aldehyde-activating protein [Sphingomonas deserti]